MKKQPVASTQGLSFPVFTSLWRISLFTRELKHALFQTQTPTGREHFACLERYFSQIFLLFIFNGEKKLSNTNVAVWGQVKSEISSLPVAVRVSKTRVLKLRTVLLSSQASIFPCGQLLSGPVVPAKSKSPGQMLNWSRRPERKPYRN